MVGRNPVVHEWMNAMPLDIHSTFSLGKPPQWLYILVFVNEQSHNKQDSASVSTESWLIILDVYLEVPWQNYMEDPFLIGAGTFILISLMAGLILPPAVNIERSKESSSLCHPLAFDVFILTALDGLCILIYLLASVFSFISLMAQGWTYFFSCLYWPFVHPHLQTIC